MNKPSLVEKLGGLPMRPDDFKSALTPQEKWLVDYQEDFCTSCGTITPHLLTTHHKECLSWYHEDDRPKPHSDFKRNCPKCDSEELWIDSSRELLLSTISCCDCDYVLQKSMPEESLLKLFNKGKV